MRYVIALLALSSLSACGVAADDTSTGSRTFPIPGSFNAVTLGGPDNVRVVTGGTPSIVATGRNSDLDKIEVELRGSELVVTRESNTSWKLFNWNSSSKDVTVTVTVAKPIEEANLKGSGDMNVDRGAGDSFSAELRGSGDLTIGQLTTKTARLRLAGSGDLKAGGQAMAVEAELAGSGGIDATGLIAETADVDLRGSGDVAVHASKTAKVAIRGSGDVRVKGTANCTSEKHGSGDVRCEP